MLLAAYPQLLYTYYDQLLNQDLESLKKHAQFDIHITQFSIYKCNKRTDKHNHIYSTKSNPTEAHNHEL